MQLYHCVLTILLIGEGCFGHNWQVIEDFKINVRKYSDTGRSIDRVIDRFLSEKRSVSKEFLNGIERTPYLERNELRPRCTLVIQRLDGLIYSFKKQLLKLETPLINVRQEISDRLSDIYDTLDVHQKRADLKFEICRTNICLEEIQEWLRVEVGQMQCRVKLFCGISRNVTRVHRSVPKCDEFQCKNGTCITNDKVCDGEMDCADGSDETPNCDSHCVNGFHCKDLRCIDKSKVCNGVADCDDKSDEENCKESGLVQHSTTTCNVETGKFLCKNKHCVTLVEVCDGIDNCGDRSDEGPKCGEDVNCGSGCTASGGVCFSGPNGPLCISECPRGLTDNGGSCHPGPLRSPASLEEVFDQVPYLFRRYVGAMVYLKKNFMTSLERVAMGCQEPRRELTSRLVVQTS